MTVSGREKAMAAVTGVVLLYGALGLLAKSRLDAWRKGRDDYRRTVVRLVNERNLIAQRAQWEKRYEGVRHLMPVFPANQPVDTYWLGVMDRAATKNGLNIAKRQVGQEDLVGDVCEVAIDCKDWEGSLDALVHFLYDLESEGVMMDMRQMFIRPNPANHALLRGNFTLYCAYMRERPAGEGSAGAKPAGGRNGRSRK